MKFQRLYHPDPDQPRGPFLNHEPNDEESEDVILLNLLKGQLKVIDNFRPSIKSKLKIAIHLEFDVDSNLLDEMYSSFFELFEEREDILDESCNTVLNHDELKQVFIDINDKSDELINLIFQATKDSYNPGEIFRLIVRLSSLYKKAIRITKESF